MCTYCSTSNTLFFAENIQNSIYKRMSREKSFQRSIEICSPIKKCSFFSKTENREGEEFEREYIFHKAKAR